MLTITGVTGRTGGAIAESLLANGTAVRVVVRKLADVERWRALGAHVAVADFLDERALTHALAGSDALFALLPEDLSVPDFHAHRRRMADALAVSVRAARVPHVVFLSSLAAAAPAGPARDLRHAEDALAATGCKLLILRAAFFQDNLAAAIAVAREHGMFASFLPTEDTAIAMVATADVAALVTACLMHPAARGGVVEVVGPAYSSAQVAEQLGRALDRSLDVVTIPPLGQLDFLRRVGVPPAFAQALVELYAWLGAPRTPSSALSVTGTTTLAETLDR
ncbi:MAG TPA: NAD(P)H-binding protein, partial [Kofleriaceae bacterium]|nr:NAD(P)H-binding protein [Kofleriaceae bacterium]